MYGREKMKKTQSENKLLHVAEEFFHCQKCSIGPVAGKQVHMNTCNSRVSCEWKEREKQKSNKM